MTCKVQKCTGKVIVQYDYFPDDDRNYFVYCCLKCGETHQYMDYPNTVEEFVQEELQKRLDGSL